MDDSSGLFCSTDSTRTLQLYYTAPIEFLDYCTKTTSANFFFFYVECKTNEVTESLRISYEYNDNNSTPLVSLLTLLPPSLPLGPLVCPTPHPFCTVKLHEHSIDSAP